MDKKRILIGFEMMRSGDMRGSRLVRTINRQKDGRVHIKTLDMPDWRSKAKESDYVIDEDILRRLGEIFEKYNIADWRNLPEGITALDAATTTYAFLFDDNESNSANGCYNTETGGSRLRYSERISFDLNRDFPPEAYEALDEINCILDDCYKAGGE